MPRGRPSRQTVFTRLDVALADLHERFGGLPAAEEYQDVWQDIWHLEAHHSTAMEGNTLVMREVATLLEQQRAVGAKPLREYMEVKGYADAAAWVYQEALAPHAEPSGDLITVQEVRHIHRLVMGPVWEVAPHLDASGSESPGNFRQHDIQPFGGGMIPPSWPLISAELSAWVVHVNTWGIDERTDGESEHLAEKLADMHAAFERIHPFLDGSGRVGRLVMNLILVRLGHPPVVILKQRRAAYIEAMRRADAGDNGSLGELIARAMIESLNRFVFPKVAGPAKHLPLAALADHELGVDALRQAARRGRLRAIQRTDGQWMSSRRAIDEYKKSRSSRGRRSG